MIQPVRDFTSNIEENIESAAKAIAKSKHKRAVFEEVYRGKSPYKRVSELMAKTHLNRNRVLDAGKKLYGFIRQTKIEGETAYGKEPAFIPYKNRILRLADSPRKLANYPTKRKLRAILQPRIVSCPARSVRTTQVTIGDLDSFRKTRKNRTLGFLGDKLSESQFKEGLKRILGERGVFRDWPGETSDIYTTKLLLRGRRIPAAFALKGPAVKTKLTPKSMGKNGEQIQRLFSAPAELFLVQYCREIDPSVIKQMQICAISLSYLTGKRIYYGVIDGQDSLSIVRAYSRYFRAAGRA